MCHIILKEKLQVEAAFVEAHDKSDEDEIKKHGRGTQLECPVEDTGVGTNQPEYKGSLSDYHDMVTIK